MSLRQMHETHERMRKELANDHITQTTLDRTVREARRRMTEQLFQLIPESVLPFAYEHAWHVFDDNAPGPLEDFLVATVSKSQSGHSIHVQSSRFDACDAAGLSGIILHMHNLTEAWKEHLRILVQPHETGATIIFFAI